MKKIFVSIIAMSSVLTFATNFECSATLTHKGESKTVNLTEFRKALTANLDGFAVAAQVDEFEDVGAFKILILDQERGRVASTYSGPAPVKGGLSASVSTSVARKRIVVVCKAN